jgi:hypothetical protein
MADIFLSYGNSGRPSAERLNAWFEKAERSAWIDRDIGLSKDGTERLHRELTNETLVVTSAVRGSALRMDAEGSYCRLSDNSQ